MGIGTVLSLSRRLFAPSSFFAFAAVIVKEKEKINGLS